MPFNKQVIPAKAGVHSADFRKRAVYRLDSPFAGMACEL
jgi:hypothetical protein